MVIVLGDAYLQHKQKVQYCLQTLWEPLAQRVGLLPIYVIAKLKRIHSEGTNFSELQITYHLRYTQRDLTVNVSKVASSMPFTDSFQCVSPNFP